MKKKGLFGLVMALCCLLPILALFTTLPQLNTKASSFNWSWLLMLLCPLLHILLMHGVLRGGSCHTEGNQNEEPGYNKER